MLKSALSFLTVMAVALLVPPASLRAQPAPGGYVDPIAAAEPITYRAVIELFTSQGCSSCPPADELLGKLATEKDVIALTFPVDYWDYLGWKDTLASSRNSDRQRGYAKARGDGAIYTPQAVVNGIAHVNGARRADIDRAIETTNESIAKNLVPVRFWQERNTINIAIAPAESDSPPREATIWLGVVQSRATVKIDHGENAGKSVTYNNVVRELAPVGLWRGQAMRIQLPRGAVMLPETGNAVVLIQEGRFGAIIGAAWGSLY